MPLIGYGRMIWFYNNAMRQSDRNGANVSLGWEMRYGWLWAE